MDAQYMHHAQTLVQHVLITHTHTKINVHINAHTNMSVQRELTTHRYTHKHTNKDTHSMNKHVCSCVTPK